VGSARRALLAILGGLLLYAGHPPLAQWWIGFVALVPLLALARDASRGPRPLRSGFGWGTLAGVVSFSLLVGWVRLVDPLALVLLVTYLSLYIGAFVGGLAAWGDRRGRAVAAVVSWVALEALRGTAPFGGFPWGVLGYTQAGGGPALPVARVLGVLGVSAVLAGTAVALHSAWRRGLAAWRVAASDGLPPGEAAVTAARAPTLAFVTLLVVPVVLSGLAAAPVPSGSVLDVAAVQGFDVEGSTGRELPRSIVIADKMLQTTREAVAGGGVPDLTIWPENALDADIAEHAEVRERVDAASAALDGGPLVTGMIVDGADPGTWQNTIVQLHGTTEVDRYVKRQPVPFGEYIPFRSVLGWYPTIQRLRPTDSLAGTEPGVFDVAGARVGVVICFESIFPRLVHSVVTEGAELLVVVTNNSSFGRTPMSDQHVAFSQMRAVETGRWVVHSALSGVSALVDPDGVVHERTGLYSQDVIRAEVPLVDGFTVATRLGEAPAWGVMLAAALGAAWLVRDRRRARRMAGEGVEG
jgi:apolipoprotein N-acyltransferase